jgi:hypothetical protein
LATTLKLAGTAAPLQPVKSPSAKVPLVTTAPGSRRASTLLIRPARALSAATRKPASSLIAAAVPAICQLRVVFSAPTAAAIPASVCTRV